MNDLEIICLQCKEEQIPNEQNYYEGGELKACTVKIRKLCRCGAHEFAIVPRGSRFIRRYTDDLKQLTNEEKQANYQADRAKNRQALPALHYQAGNGEKNV